MSVDLLTGVTADELAEVFVPEGEEPAYAGHHTWVANAEPQYVSHVIFMAADATDDAGRPA